MLFRLAEDDPFRALFDGKHIKKKKKNKEAQEKIRKAKLADEKCAQMIREWYQVAYGVRDNGATSL
jgi:hypothetical protein